VAVVDEQEASTVDEAGSTVVKPYTASVTRRGALGVPAAFQSINQFIKSKIKITQRPLASWHSTYSKELKRHQQIRFRSCPANCLPYSTFSITNGHHSLFNDTEFSINVNFFSSDHQKLGYICFFYLFRVMTTMKLVGGGSSITLEMTCHRSIGR